MPGSKKWALPVAVLGCLVVATLSSHGRPPQPTPAAPTAEVSSFALVGVANNACLTSLRACLAALPGIDHFTLDTRSLSFTPKPGWAAPLAAEVVACVRSGGHDVAGRSEPDPDFPALTAEEVARLDAIPSEWVVVHLGPARCSACAAVTADRLREVRGVRASYRLEPGIAVQRQPSCRVSTIAEAARASIRGTVEVEATHPVTLHIEGMQCHKCIATVSLALGRTPGVLRFDVTVGQATVVATSTTDPARVVDAIDNAPPPT